MSPDIECMSKDPCARCQSKELGLMGHFDRATQTFQRVLVCRSCGSELPDQELYGVPVSLEPAAKVVL